MIDVAPAGEADDNLGLSGSRQGDNARLPMSVRIGNRSNRAIDSRMFVVGDDVLSRRLTTSISPE